MNIFKVCLLFLNCELWREFFLLFFLEGNRKINRVQRYYGFEPMDQSSLVFVHWSMKSAIVKLLLPLRIGLSLMLTPWLASILTRSLSSFFFNVWKSDIFHELFQWKVFLAKIFVVQQTFEVGQWHLTRFHCISRVRTFWTMKIGKKPSCLFQCNNSNHLQFNRLLIRNVFKGKKTCQRSKRCPQSMIHSRFEQFGLKVPARIVSSGNLFIEKYSFLHRFRTEGEDLRRISFHSSVFNASNNDLLDRNFVVNPHRTSMMMMMFLHSDYCSSSIPIFPLCDVSSSLFVFKIVENLLTIWIKRFSRDTISLLDILRWSKAKRSCWRKREENPIENE